MVLGRYFTDTDDKEYYASGSVDELMFFNAKLSDSDIEALVNLYKWDVSISELDLRKREPDRIENIELLNK